VCASAYLAWTLRTFLRGREYPTRLLRTEVAFGPSLVASTLFAVGFAMTAVASSGRPAWGLAAVFVVLAGGLSFAVAKASAGEAQR
jgi:FtsH-binding integral membrane protein